MQQLNGRFMAFFIHMLISIGLLALLLAVVRWAWFPGALFDIAGGVQGLRILIPVDLVLGPLITLVVFNKAKPKSELIRDMSIVAAVQAVALIAGMFVVHSVRPVALVHVFDTVYVLKTRDLDNSGIELKELDRLPGRYPKFLYVNVPSEAYDFALAYSKNMLSGSVPFEYRVDLYEPLPEDLSLFPSKLGGDARCLKVDVESDYSSGQACLNLIEKKLVGFGDSK